MKLSIEIPDAWGPKLKVAVAKAGSQSVSDFLRAFIQKTIDETPLEKSWGGSRQGKQDEQLPQVAHVEQNAPKPPPEGLKSLSPKEEAEIVKSIARVPDPRPSERPLDRPALKETSHQDFVKPKSQKTGMATPKNPDLQLPANYRPKPSIRVPGTPIKRDNNET